MLKCLLQKAVSVGNTCLQFSCVDKVEPYLVEPVILKVVDLESAVRWVPDSRQWHIALWGCLHTIRAGWG